MILILGLTCVVYLLVSMWKENRFGWPLRGIIWFTLAVVGSYAIALDRRIRLEGSIVGKGLAPSGSSDIRVGMNMQITEVKIRPANEALVKAYVRIVFDNCFAVDDIRIIKGPTGLFVSMPNRKQRDGTHRQLAYPANAETRMMIQRVILAEYEKFVDGSGSVPSVRSASERLRALEQLKTDGLINEEEYNTKRTEILGEL